MHVVWELDVPADIRCRLVSTLLKRGRVISVDWLNNAINKLLHTNTPEISLRYMLYYASPGVVQASNYEELVLLVHKTKDSLKDINDDAKTFHTDKRLTIAMERRAHEFKIHLKSFKSEEERSRYDDDMTLSLY